MEGGRGHLIGRNGEGMGIPRLGRTVALENGKSPAQGLAVGKMGEAAEGYCLPRPEAPKQTMSSHPPGKHPGFVAATARSAVRLRLLPFTLSQAASHAPSA